MVHIGHTYTKGLYMYTKSISIYKSHSMKSSEYVRIIIANFKKFEAPYKFFYLLPHIATGTPPSPSLSTPNI